METQPVSAEVYSTLKTFTKNKVISQPERLALELQMGQDGLDAAEKKVLAALAAEARRAQEAFSAKQEAFAARLKRIGYDPAFHRPVPADGVKHS